MRKKVTVKMIERSQSQTYMPWKGDKGGNSVTLKVYMGSQKFVVNF